MNLFLKKWWHLLFVLSIPIQGLIYVMISRNVTVEPFNVNFWIDEQIPLLTWFAIPYAIWMPLLYFTFIYFGIVDRVLYWRSIITYNISVMICNIIFWLFPTTMPRPAINGNDPASQLIQFIYANDAPLNCFPSVHVLTSYLLFIIINRHKLMKPGLRNAMSILLWMIIASTVFIKQHGLIDVIGGIAIAEITYQAVKFFTSRKTAGENNTTLKKSA